MIRCNFIPYEGEENFIFVSYAHKDSALVFPIIEDLNRQGYRIWYDDGIAPGSEWPEDIADHLNRCALMLSFISANSLASDNCRREITYSLAKKKSFLAVILEPVEMTPGMEMQLSAQQCVLKYSYQTEEAFMRKLCSSQSLACCREVRPAVPPVAPVPAARPVQSPVVAHAPVVQHVQPPVVVSAPVVPMQVQQPDPAPYRAKKPVDQVKKQPSGGKKAMLFGGIGAACLILVLLVVFLMPGLRKIQITEDKAVSPHETYLSLYNTTVTAETAAAIGQLTKLESLTFNNCSFAPGALAKLGTLNTLTSLIMTDCSGVDDLAFLKNQVGLITLELTDCDLADAVFPAIAPEKLRSVNLSGNSAWKDLTKLQDCVNLQSLNISGTGVQSLAPLEVLPLTNLDFSNTAVSDVTALGNMQTLSVVHGAYTKVNEIDALAGLKELHEIDFTGCQLYNVYTQFQALRLWGLYLGDTGVTNLAAFSDMTVLRNVDVHGNAIYDIDFLAKSAATLETLDVSGNFLGTESLRFLSNAPELTQLRMDGIYGEDLAFLANCTKLEVICAVYCGLKDISALANCPALKEVILADNEITDISSLKNLQTKWLQLDLSYNPITDAADLPKVQYKLLALLCEELDPTTIPQLEGNFAVLYYSDDCFEQFMSRKTFSKYMVLNCPADKQVALEDSVGKHRLCLAADREALVQLLKEEGLHCDYLLK